MKTTSVAALALSALNERDPILLQQKFQHLTAPNLKEIDSLLCTEETRILAEARHHDYIDAENIPPHYTTDHNQVLAEAVLRSIVFRGLGKFRHLYPSGVVQEALSSHPLPEHLQDVLVQRYGATSAKSPPKTWDDALQQLMTLATVSKETLGENKNNNSDLSRSEALDKRKLWQLILDHPMTAYQPFQCLQCGQVIVDDVHSTPVDDFRQGLSMVKPNGSELDLRGGWFRGKPHSSKTVFQLDCPNCGQTSRWYRSGHPKMLLNPAIGWGRLCGEQEDLRLHLASYLDIPIRICFPLDWDHVWTEFLLPNQSDMDEIITMDQSWDVRDDSARNFAVRLDEGIGSWTGVLAISPDPNWCEDVTGEYLSTSSCKSGKGRVDKEHAHKMNRYRDLVERAQNDSTGDCTQAKTVSGYVLRRANWSADDVSAIMKRAAKDYGNKEWWNLIEPTE